MQCGMPRQSLTPQSPLSPAAYTRFQLADGVSACTGRVEVEARGVWGPLCATPGTCLMHTSSAVTWAVGLLSPCPHPAVLGQGWGCCGAVPSDALGTSGTRASAPWRCWGSPPAPPGTLQPSTAQVGVGAVGSPSRWGALPKPTAQPGCCRCRRAPAAARWGEPL